MEPRAPRRRPAGSSAVASSSSSSAGQGLEDSEIQPLLGSERAGAMANDNGKVVAEQDIDQIEDAKIQADLHEQTAQQIQNTRLSLTSCSSIQMYWFFFIAYCNSWGTGFDSSMSGTMNSNNLWHSQLGIPKDGGLLGIVTAIYTIGNLCGCFFAGPATDRYGRRWGMFIGSCIVLVGAILTSTSHYYHQYMAGRFFLGFGVAIARSAAPAFVAEFAPSPWRGPVVSLYNSLWLVGAIIASAIANATGPLKTSWSWRLPLVIQVIPSCIVILFCLWLPESPRWLIANDRHEEAQAILTKYHAAGDAQNALVTYEMAEMRESIRLEASDKRWYDYSELWSSRSNRYRTFMVISIACIGQWGGSNLTGYYLANVLRAIGIKDQHSLLIYNLAYYVASIGGAAVGSLLSNRVGRRQLLIFGCLSMSACLIGLTVLTSQYHLSQPEEVSRLTIAFIFFVGIFHSCGINPLVVGYPVECLHTNTRAKGMGLNNFALNLAEFVNTYATPIALKRISWRLYIVYIGWNIVQALWIYVFFVETRGHTLEEMDSIFENKHPVRKSLETRKTLRHPIPIDT